MNTIATIQSHIVEIASKSPLRAPDVTLLGASKGQNSETIEAAINAGLSHFGENRVQEAQAKWPILKHKYPHITLHLIGPLQTNKVREALELFDVIQTVDRPSLALALMKELEKRGKRDEEKSTLSPHPSIPPSLHPSFYIQVNTGQEPQKAGVAPKEASEFIGYCRGLGLNVVGLMCVPPANEMPAPHFALLRKIAAEHGLEKLSMGMSADYETAIRMGSSCVRLGTALFGSRA